MKRINTTAVLLAAALIAACGGDENNSGSMAGGEHDPLAGGETAISSADPSQGKYEETPQAAAAGATLYQTYCTRCHGHNGEGGIGPSFLDKDFVYGGEPKQVFASIAEGRPKGMPAHGDVLTAQQIWHLVAHVEALSKQPS